MDNLLGGLQDLHTSLCNKNLFMIILLIKTEYRCDPRLHFFSIVFRLQGPHRMLRISSITKEPCSPYTAEAQGTPERDDILFLGIQLLLGQAQGCFVIDRRGPGKEIRAVLWQKKSQMMGVVSLRDCYSPLVHHSPTRI